VERRSPALRTGDVLRVRQTCHDGDPECDVDATADGRCVMNVALCLNVFDYRERFLGAQELPVCDATLLRRARLSRVRGGRDGRVAASRRALRAAVRALPLPSTLQHACTATIPVEIPIPARRASGHLSLTARVKRAATTTTARLKLRCVAAR
jgi:hypothetical protein